MVFPIGPLNNAKNEQCNKKRNNMESAKIDTTLKQFSRLLGHLTTNQNLSIHKVPITLFAIDAML